MAKSPTNLDSMALGARIRRMREIRGLRSVELADSIDIDATYMSRIETGKRRPNPQLLDKIAAALTTTPEYLVAALGYAENPKPVRFGDLILSSAYLMAGSFTHPVPIQPLYEHIPLKVPDAVADRFDELVAIIKLRSNRPGRSHPNFNGPNTRLLQARLTIEQSSTGEEVQTLVLELAPVSWFEYLALNSLIDDPIVFRDGKRTLRSEFGIERLLYDHTGDLRWCQLSNILSVNMLPITSDGFGLVTRRNPRGVQAGAGRFVGGVTENIHRFLDEASPDNARQPIAAAARDGLKASILTKVDHTYQPAGVPSPILTARRGLGEEISRAIERVVPLDNYHFLAVIMDIELFDPHLTGVIELGLTRMEVARAIGNEPGRDNMEWNEFRFVKLDASNAETMAMINAQEMWTVHGLATFLIGMHYWNAKCRDAGSKFSL